MILQISPGTDELPDDFFRCKLYNFRTSAHFTALTFDQFEFYFPVFFSPAVLLIRTLSFPFP